MAYDEKHIGNEVYSTRYQCPHCGSYETDYDGYCVHCGEYVVEYEPEPAPKPAAKMQRPNSKQTGKNMKKPVFKKWWFWVIIVILLAAIAGGSGSSKKKSDSGASDKDVSAGTDSQQKSETQNAAAKTPDEKTVYSVGDTLHDGNLDIVYVASGEYTESNELMQPKDGNKYIFLKLAFVNTSGKSDAHVSLYNFECYADGYSCEQYFGGEDDLSATLSSGRSTEGYVYFEVPQDARNIEIEYDTNFFTADKITFTYEGDKDSGYALEKNSTVTENALHVGDVAESSNLNISYISCMNDTSYDATFSKPKDGYKYITCEFEFENKSKSDYAVSFFSFNCYADGANCESAYFRDDGISATLSSGRKTKGTVTFMVPMDATIVEVEYLSDFWTSKHVVFDASNPS